MPLRVSNFLVMIARRALCYYYFIANMSHGGRKPAKRCYLHPAFHDGVGMVAGSVTRTAPAPSDGKGLIMATQVLFEPLLPLNSLTRIQRAKLKLIWT